LPREQYKKDSAYAFYRFSLTKDSGVIRKYLKGGYRPPVSDPVIKKAPVKQQPKKDNALPVTQVVPMIDPEKTNHPKSLNRRNESA
jgi:hypothetical protein